MRALRARWAATGLTAALFLLLAANVPFYSGSTPVDGFSWRMEHGRLTLWRSDVQTASGFWLDWNSEGLHWSPRVKINGPDDWKLTLPVWIPLAGALAWCYVAWRPRGTAPSS
jgi:hypothetical protein